MVTFVRENIFDIDGKEKNIYDINFKATVKLLIAFVLFYYSCQNLQNCFANKNITNRAVLIKIKKKPQT